MSIEVTLVVTGPFAENSYVVHDTETRDAVIIDPGDDPGRILRTVEQAGARPLAVLLTHGHNDHVGAVARILETFDVPLLCHEGDQPWLDGVEKQGRMFGLRVGKVPKPTRYVTDNEELTFGSLQLKVIHTPGHSAGGVCYLLGRILFAGDTIFQGSVGRSDFPDGSHDQLIESIETRILPLGDDVAIYSGHGPETTVAREKRTNPFLG